MQNSGVVGDCDEPTYTENPRVVERNQRDARQAAVLAWVKRELLSDGTALQRARRLVEEALELFQAVGGDAETAARIAAHVFARPVGEVKQEVGGVAITLMALCETLGVSVADAELIEFNRIHSFPHGHFHARQREKIKAGL